MKKILLISVFALACQGELDQTERESDTGVDSTNDSGQKQEDMPGSDTPSNNMGDDSGTSTDTGGNDDMGQIDMDTPPVPHQLVVAESSGTLSTFSFDEATGQATLLDSDASAGTISFAAFNPQRIDRVYTTSGASVRGYSRDAANGELGFLSAGTMPDNGTHLEVDESGQVLITVSFGGDSISLLPLDANGEPQDAVQTLGGGGDPTFCDRAHQVRIAPANDFAYVPCLGSEYIQVLALDVDGQTLNSIQTAAVPNGSGPRHMDFHPTLPYVYVINEIASTISIFSRDENTGMLTAIDTVSNLPVGIVDGSASSDIHVSDDGQHLYAVNRQPRHEIAAYEINQDGSLTLIDHYDGMGEHSRSFELSAEGGYLFMGNRNSNNLVSFTRNVDTGALTFLNADTNFPGGPMFVGFIPNE